jgi:addiction module HigA family antidote
MARPAIHPGEILADELDEPGMSAESFGRALHIPTNRVTQIVRGQRPVTADTALRIGHFLGTGPELWLRLQQAYDLRVAEQTVGAEIRSTITPLRQSASE